jgi:hypothetical protein
MEAINNQSGCSIFIDRDAIQTVKLFVVELSVARSVVSQQLASVVPPSSMQIHC